MRFQESAPCSERCMVQRTVPASAHPVRRSILANMSRSVVDRIQEAVRNGLPRAGRALLAVSGGADSMVLLHAANAVRKPAELVVATFDHGSGPHAAAAADLVERVAISLGVSVVVGRGSAAGRPTEAAWRGSRLAFLRA